ncbi:GyrI-like domain-containing protein [Litchfieldia alkalitelluris]|uniref:GyrI-like domain-containing protein n=1 Tax=Litchfieldia alkalitelluris TaxID=304268 RepID=UPI000996D289|nr:GyrI-like domain-containing protein [Litchfieldia alkalitelluris]
MTIKIVKRDSAHIIGMKIETLLKDTREQMIIPKLQQSFNKRLKEVNGAIDLPITYGIFIDPPNYNPAQDPFIWIAGVECSVDSEPPVGMISYTLPKATYAVLEYQGDIDNASVAYNELYEWIKDSDYEQEGLYGFEMYSTVHSSLDRRKAEFLLLFPIRLKNSN